MIALLLAIAAQATAPPAMASVDGLPIGAIGRQSLPAKGCAAFLWNLSGTRHLVAMAAAGAGAEPAQLRLSIDGRQTDLARGEQSGAGGFGFAGVTRYRSATLDATLDMDIQTRADLSAGAVVPQATLRIERSGRDTIVLPVAGLIGCA